MTKPVHISDLERAERKRVDWNRVHIEADRRPWLSGLFPRLGSYRGEGMRRESGKGRFA